MPQLPTDEAVTHRPEPPEVAGESPLPAQGRPGSPEEAAAGLVALVDTARELVGCPDGELLHAVVRRARLLFAADLAALALPEDDADGGPAAGDRPVLRIRACDGHIAVPTVGSPLSLTTGLVPRALATLAPIATADYLADGSFRHDETTDAMAAGEGLRGVMLAPLHRDGRRLGVLGIGSRAARQFTAAETALMTSLTGLVSAALTRGGHPPRTIPAGPEAPEVASTRRRLLDLALAGTDPAAFTAEAADLLGGPVALLGAGGTVLAAAGGTGPGWPGPELTQAEVAARTAGGPVRAGAGVWAVPVTAGGAHLGVLLARPDGVPDEDLLALAGQVAAVLLRLDGRDEVADPELRDELLDGLLRPPPRGAERVERAARRLGLDPGRSYLVVLVRPERGSLAKAAAWAGAFAHRHGGLAGSRDGCAVLVLPGEDAGEAAREVGDEVRSALGAEATVAGGGPGSGVRSVHQAYRDARCCLDAMLALGVAGGSSSTGDLGFCGMLLSEHADPERFVQATIGQVLAHDRRHATDLSRTLEAYFGTGGSPTNAARDLHVHPNTVARRLRRVDDLIGSGWQEPGRALEIQVALRLARIAQLLRERRPAARPDGSAAPAG